MKGKQYQLTNYVDVYTLEDVGVTPTDYMNSIREAVLPHGVTVEVVLYADGDEEISYKMIGTKKSLIAAAAALHEMDSGGSVSFSEEEVLEVLEPYAA